jgi:hypothetical protein
LWPSSECSSVGVSLLMSNTKIDCARAHKHQNADEARKLVAT